MRSPFTYGGTVSKRSFTNRKVEIERLYGNLTGGINTCIISPRRWGKSSLVERVVAKIQRNNKQHRVVMIDLFSVNSEGQFLELFAREVIKASSTKLDDWTKTTQRVFKKLIPRISFSSAPGMEFGLEFDWDEAKKYRDEILNLPDVIGKRKKLKFVICIDEFQNIMNYQTGEDLEKAMRAYWQRHKQTTYCLYGSKRHMMSDIFNDPSRPFYRFGDIIFLQKIELKEWIRFITLRFKQTGKSITKELAAKIATDMANHSWYVQQFAHFVWLRTKTEVTPDIVKRARREIMMTHQPFFMQTIDICSRTQLNLLRAVVAGETRMTSTAAMRKHKLGTPNNVSKNLQTLKERDIIDEYDDTYIFLDPVFELWFKKRIA